MGRADRDAAREGPLFLDRVQAGEALARELAPLVRGADVLVLGLPRGGVPVAARVAQHLGAPLDVWPVRKLGVPGSEELAMGALSAGGVVELDRSLLAALELPERSWRPVIERETRELARRERLYRGGRPAPDVRGRTVVVVDDGLATGATMHAAVSSLRALAPARVLVAVPVASRQACEALGRHADDCVCLALPEPFWAVGVWYADFGQTRDEEVVDCLERARARGAPAAAEPPLQPGAGAPGVRPG